MTTIVQDTFTDADGTSILLHDTDVPIGGAWGKFTGTGSDATIQSNRLNPKSNSHLMYYVGSGESDCTISVDVVIPNDTNYASGILFRASDFDNAWWIDIERTGGGTAHLRLVRQQSGSATVDDQDNFAVDPTNSTVRITVVLNGTSISGSVPTGESVSVTSSFNQSIENHGLTYYTVAPYVVADFDSFLIEIGGSSQTINLSSVTSGLSFGTSKLNPKIFTSPIASALSFGTLKANPLIYTTSRSSTLSIGTLKLNPVIYLTSKVSSLSIGTLKLNPLIYLTSKASGLTFGTLSLSSAGSPTTINLTSRSSTLSIGTLRLNPIIYPNTKSSGLTLGTPSLTSRATIYPATRSSTLTFGTITVGDIAQVILCDPLTVETVITELTVITLNPTNTVVTTNPADSVITLNPEDSVVTLSSTATVEINCG